MNTRTAWERQCLLREKDRPTINDYIPLIFDEFYELHGDRHYGDDAALMGGIARIDGMPVTVLAEVKGRDLNENKKTNFAMPHPEGYRKALRLAKQAEKFHRPVICFIDTPGAFPGIASEERHIGEAIAVNLRDMFSFTVPVVAVIVGEGGSGGAIGIGVGNKVLIMENAYYSVITPEGCAAILWKDRKFAPQAAEALKLTAEKLMELGIADEIIREPLGGAHRNPDQAAAFLKASLLKNLATFADMTPEAIKQQRYDKFRAMGKFEQLTAADTVSEQA